MTTAAGPGEGAVLLDPGVAAAAAEEAAAAFAEAAARCGARERVYVLSGRRARVRVAGERLAAIVHLPFAHLEVPVAGAGQPGHVDSVAFAGVDATRVGAGSDVDLRIDLWDPSECGVAVPSSSLGAVDASNRPPVGLGRDGRYLGHRLLYTLVWLDRVRSSIVGSVDPSGGLMLFERGRPLYFPLMTWLRDRRVQFVHGGMVARGGDGLLLCGQSGSGKSTTTLLCLMGGFDFLGDDYIGIEPDGDGFVGHSLFSSTYVDPDNLRRFPLLEPFATHGTGPGEDKSVVLLHEVLPQRLATRARVRALLLPEVTGSARTRVERSSRGHALRRAAPSSILQLLAPDPAALGRLGALVEAVPCFRVALGRDTDRIAGVLGDLLAELVAAGE